MSKVAKAVKAVAGAAVSTVTGASGLILDVVKEIIMEKPSFIARHVAAAAAKVLNENPELVFNTDGTFNLNGLLRESAKNISSELLSADDQALAAIIYHWATNTDTFNLDAIGKLVDELAAKRDSIDLNSPELGLYDKVLAELSNQEAMASIAPTAASLYAALNSDYGSEEKKSLALASLSSSVTKEDNQTLHAIARFIVDVVIKRALLKI